MGYTASVSPLQEGLRSLRDLFPHFARCSLPSAFLEGLEPSTHLSVWCQRVQLGPVLAAQILGFRGCPWLEFGPFHSFPLAALRGTRDPTSWEP